MQRLGIMSILGILLTAVTARADLNKEAFLNAIRQVESGGDDMAIGHNGERGAYQFNKATWQMHTKEGHRAAHDPNWALTIAFSHLDWLIARVGTDPAKLAIAWNGGVGAVKRPTKKHKDYARRVKNLYEEAI